MKTFTNSIKYRNPQTNDFETLPGLVGPGGGVHVGAKEPTNTNVNVWVTTEKENYYEIPEINDEIVSSEDTWSSQKISGEINAVNTAINYSTSEVKTNDTWIDGKPIYQRTYVGKTIKNGTATIGTIENYAIIIKTEGMSRANATVEWWIPMNAFYSVNANQAQYSFSQCRINANNVEVYTGNNGYDNADCYVTVVYTKTTD